MNLDPNLTLYLGAGLVIGAVVLLSWALVGSGAGAKTRSAAAHAGAAVGDLRQVVTEIGHLTPE